MTVFSAILELIIQWEYFTLPIVSERHWRKVEFIFLIARLLDWGVLGLNIFCSILSSLALSQDYLQIFVFCFPNKYI